MKQCAVDGLRLGTCKQWSQEDCCSYHIKLLLGLIVQQRYVFIGKDRECTPID